MESRLSKTLGVARPGSEVESLAYDVAKLQCFPQWLDTLAFWHHQEWRKGQAAMLFDPPASSRVDDLRARRVHLREHLGGTDFPVTLVAHHKDQPIGSVSMLVYRFLGKPAGHWLTNLYVQPNYRSRGVGQRLMESILAYAEACGVKEVRLFTRDQQAYYQKRAWRLLNRARVLQQDVDIFAYTLPRSQGANEPAMLPQDC